MKFFVLSAPVTFSLRASLELRSEIVDTNVGPCVVDAFKLVNSAWEGSGMRRLGCVSKSSWATSISGFYTSWLNWRHAGAALHQHALYFLDSVTQVDRSWFKPLSSNSMWCGFMQRVWIWLPTPATMHQNTSHQSDNCWCPQPKNAGMSGFSTALATSRCERTTYGRVRPVHNTYQNRTHRRV